MRIYYPARGLRGQPYSSGNVNVRNLKALMARPERHAPEGVLAAAGAFAQVDFDFGEYTDFDYVTEQGTFYIPRSISFSDGRDDDFMDLCFVVMIGEELELRRLLRDLRQPWHVTVGQDEPLSDPETIARVELSMALLMEANQPRKAPGVASLSLPLEYLLDLLRLLGVDQPEALAGRIADAAKAPRKFFKAQVRELEEEFGIAEPYAGWHLDLLRAELERLGRVERVDWKEAPEEVLAKLMGLLPPEAQALLGSRQGLIASGEAYPPEVLKACQDILDSGCGLTLLLWDTGADEYTFLFAERAKMLKLCMLAELLGIGLRTLEDELNS